MAEEKKPVGNLGKPVGNLGKMREILKKNQAKVPQIQLPMKPGNNDKEMKVGLVTAAASPEITPKKRKNNFRSAKARDLRSKAHGRMPIETWFSAEWNGKSWKGYLKVWEVETIDGVLVPRSLVKNFSHDSDGLFRLLEEMDCMFWEWFAKIATEEEKKRLTFAPDPPSPAPFPTPSEPVDTASSSQ